MSEQLIYLAGPMTGLLFEEARRWRNEAKERLESLLDPETGVRVYRTLDPCRGKEYLEGHVLQAMDDEGLGWGDIVVPRDKYDVTRSDIVLFNLLPAVECNEPVVRDFGDAISSISMSAEARSEVYNTARRLFGGAVSIGTMFEMAWAREYGKFSLVVMQKGNPHEHEFVKKHSSVIVNSLEDAYGYLEKVLNS